MSRKDSNSKLEIEFRDFTQDERRSQEETFNNRRREEKALVRRLDFFIAPVMMLLMLISYLDRGNIGFAATQGMIQDIHLQGSQLNVRCHHCFILHAHSLSSMLRLLYIWALD
jgi:hypothetical protein